MLRTRVIPILLLHNESLVKTIKFKKFNYIGDPINSVRIFNELEVDELIFLDITVSKEKKKPNLKLLSEISNECFMPLSYGGGIDSLDKAKEIFDIGFEKISINTSSLIKPELITQISKHYGSQAIIVSMDIKKNMFGKPTVRMLGGKKDTGKNPIEWAKEIEDRGAGEILITSIDNEGTWNGFDINNIKQITENVSIPVIAHGGGGTIEDIAEVINKSNASAVALGSMIVFQKKDMGVLLNFPDKKKLEKIFL